MNTILNNDYSIPLSPKLASAVGLNEAIVLQQAHYWLSKCQNEKNHQYDGKCWFYKTFDEWQKEFPFWGMRTIKRIIYGLIEDGLLVVSRHNKKLYDRTNWYSIDYEALESSLKKSLCQNDTMDSDISAQWIVPILPDGLCQGGTTYTIDYTENTSKENSITAGWKTRFEGDLPFGL